MPPVVCYNGTMVISSSSVPSRSERVERTRAYKEGARARAARQASLDADKVLESIDSALDNHEEEDVD